MPYGSLNQGLSAQARMAGVAQPAMQPPMRVQGDDDTRSTSTSSSLKRKRKGDHKFYAVRTGHKPGIYHSWPDCQQQVTGYKAAVCGYLRIRIG